LLKSDKNIKYFILRTQWVYNNISLNSYQKKFEIKLLEDLQYTFNTAHVFFENRAVYEIITKTRVKILRLGITDNFTKNKIDVHIRKINFQKRTTTKVNNSGNIP
jgi:hypothetical protein